MRLKSMKNIAQKAVIFSSFFLLASCASTERPASSSQVEGLFTKLKKAIAALDNTFTAEGTLEYGVAYGDGSSTNQEVKHFDVLAEYGDSAYYYREQEQSTGESTSEERRVPNASGDLVIQSLDYFSNEVGGMSYPGVKYEDDRHNYLAEIDVSDVKAIKSQQNWYELARSSPVLSKAVYFLTGYQAGGDDGLSIIQFAFHFDGDAIDRFRFVLDHTETSDDDYSEEAFTFDLDILKLGETTPREVDVLPEKEGNAKLLSTIRNIASKGSYTIHVNEDFESEAAKDESYSYIVEDGMFFSDRIYTGARAKTEEEKAASSPSSSEKDDDYVTYFYQEGFKDVNGVSYQFRFDPTTHELLKTMTTEAAFGMSASVKTAVLLPYLSAFTSTAVWKDKGTYLTPYESTKDYCFSMLLPAEESLSIGDLKLTLADDGSIASLLSTGTVTYSTSDDESATTKLSKTYTYSSIGESKLPDYFKNAEVKA